MEFIEWIKKNFEWFFSGIGTELFLLLCITPIIYLLKKILEKIIGIRKSESFINDNSFVKEISSPENNLKEQMVGNKSISKDEIENMAEKFLSIFKEHGVKRTQIPFFIDGEYNITLQDVKNEASIIPKLNSNLLDWTSDCFGIQRGWFEATEIISSREKKYNPLYFYKNPEKLIDLISKLIDKHGIASYKEFIQVGFLKTFKDFNEIEELEGHIIFVLQEKIGETSTNTIYKYMFTNRDLKWGYWKSRRDIKKLIRIIDKFNIYSVGYDITIEEYLKIASLNTIPREILESKNNYTWYPSDYNGDYNELISSFENEDNKRYEQEFMYIDKRIEDLLKEKREKALFE